MKTEHKSTCTQEKCISFWEVTANVNVELSSQPKHFWKFSKNLISPKSFNTLLDDLTENKLRACQICTQRKNRCNVREWHGPCWFLQIDLHTVWANHAWAQTNPSPCKNPRSAHYVRPQPRRQSLWNRSVSITDNNWNDTQQLKGQTRSLPVWGGE